MMEQNDQILGFHYNKHEKSPIAKLSGIFYLSTRSTSFPISLLTC